jgi:hypothetical protein
LVQGADQQLDEPWPIRPAGGEQARICRQRLREPPLLPQGRRDLPDSLVSHVMVQA